MKKREACGAEKSDWPADFQLQNAPGGGGSEKSGGTGGGNSCLPRAFLKECRHVFSNVSYIRGGIRVQDNSGLNTVTVIGIDPGSRVTGWGVVRERSGVLELVACGDIRAGTGDFPERLAGIYHELCGVLDRWKPEEAAVEQVFTSKNVSSALKLGQARGVAIAACASRALRINGYAPTLVKKSLVGNGRADKSQVAFMVGQMLGYSTDNWAPDTTDALGMAICHLTLRRYRHLQEQHERVRPAVRQGAQPVNWGDTGRVNLVPFSP